MYQELEQDYLLPRGAAEAYRRDGHILLPGVAPAAVVAGFRPRLRGIVREVYSRRSHVGRAEDYSSLFQQVTNVWRHDEEMRSVIFARRFARLAAELMGVRGVRLYHDQALFKPPGGKATPWHQDQIYWPLDTSNTITMWMPLMDVSVETGTMQFATGSHRDGSLIPKSISEQAGMEFQELVRERNFSVATYSLHAGDATFHSGWTVHAAHANTGKEPREVLTIIYFEDGAKIVQPDSKYRQVDMEAFHPGQKPGDAAASALNPLLYRE